MRQLSSAAEGRDLADVEPEGVDREDVDPPHPTSNSIAAGMSQRSICSGATAERGGLRFKGE